MKRWTVHDEDGEKVEQVFALPEMREEEVKSFLVKQGYPETIRLKEV